MRESRNKMQPEISVGTPEEVDSVQRSELLLPMAVCGPSVPGAPSEIKEATVAVSSTGWNVLLF